MRVCDTLLHAGVLVTQNAAMDILKNAALAIKDGKIVDLGSREEMARRWHGAKIMDYGKMLVMPGLINAHTHAAMTFLRGLADDLPLMQWLEQTVFPVESRLTSEIVRLGSLLGYAEMLSSGTTACIDMYIFEKAVFEAAQLAGIRCLGGEAIFAFPSAACPDWRQALAETRNLAEEYAGQERIKIAVNPHGVYTTTPEILRACRDLALELDVPLHIHLAETPAETARCLEITGFRPIAHADQCGLFEAQTICGHLVDITESECAFLARKQVVAVHNPSSNMKLGSGVAPVQAMLDAGVTVALGTDGPASNNTLNLFSEMARCALLHKVHDNNPTTMPATRVFDLATLGGARAFGDAELGSLEIGKKADCVALALDTPNMLPLHSPVSQLVYAASGHECRMTMVHGEVLYEDGKFTKFDYEALVRETEQLKRFVHNRL